MSYYPNYPPPNATTHHFLITCNTVGFVDRQKTGLIDTVLSATCLGTGDRRAISQGLQIQAGRIVPCSRYSPCQFRVAWPSWQPKVMLPTQ